MSTFQNNGLIQQGYNHCNVHELKNISNGLRFTPLVCMALALYGLYIQNPYLHFVIAGLGIIPFWFPSAHPFDLVYNYGFRHLVGGMKLPANPLPRRIACVMGGLMNVGIGISFMMGSVIAAYSFGVILIALQLIVITTHFCVASWMYEGIMKMLGLWNPPISKEVALQLIENGAILVDVREMDEFAAGHIPGAINVPLNTVDASDLLTTDKDLIVYCRSGMRSLDALKRLGKKGKENVFNFGGKDRW